MLQRIKYFRPHNLSALSTLGYLVVLVNRVVRAPIAPLLRFFCSQILLNRLPARYKPAMAVYFWRSPGVDYGFRAGVGGGMDANTTP